MTVLGQERMNRFWHVAVHLVPEDLVESTVHYLDPWYEMRARLRALPLDNRVESADVEVLRSPSGQAGCERFQLDDLRGAITYMGFGRRVNKATRNDPTGLQSSLLIECAKAMRQVWAWVGDRYGIDPAEHFDLIKRMLEGSCIYYRSPEAVRGVLKPWQLEQMKRWDMLFSRNKYCRAIRRDGADELLLGLSDSHHEMELQLTVRSGAIHDTNGGIMRAPHEECFQAPAQIGEVLRGAEIGEGAAAWEGRLAGAEGCAHLADLAREAHSSLVYWHGARALAQAEF